MYVLLYVIQLYCFLKCLTFWTPTSVWKFHLLPILTKPEYFHFSYFSICMCSCSSLSFWFVFFWLAMFSIFSHENFPVFIFLCEVSVYIFDFLIKPSYYFWVVRALYISYTETHCWIWKENFPQSVICFVFSLVLSFKKQNFLMMKFILSIFVHFVFSVF